MIPGIVAGGMRRGGAPVPTDPYWANVVSLLSFDGNFSDAKGRVWTNSGLTIDTVDKRFGSGSAERVVSASSLSTPNSADFTWSAQPFTIEMFVKAPTASYTPPVARRSDMLCSTDNGLTTFYWGFGVNENNRLSFSYWGGAAYVVEGTRLLNDGNWHHVLFSYDGTTLRLFSDGIADGSAARQGTPAHGSTPIRIGAGSGFSSHQFHVDELRVTKGVARHVAPFTPPDAPFPRS